MKNSKILIIFALIISTLLFCTNSNATDHYLAPNGSDEGDGSIENPWFSLDYALNKNVNGGVYARVKPGDTLYLRGGTYFVEKQSMSKSKGPELHLGTTISSPTTTIMSYPGEWAIIDGSVNGVPTYRGIRNNIGEYNIIFKNMEFRYCYQAGIDMAGDAGSGATCIRNSIFQNLYFHDNVSPASSNPAGLRIAAENCIIEYCTFKDNGDPNSIMHNSANLTLMQCYNTNDQGLDPYPRKNNIIRYNVFEGSSSAIKDKAYGNYVDSVNPDIRHPEWKNEIHHNVFINPVRGYYMRQDFVEIHHNLFINPLYAGIWYAEHEDTPPKGCWESKIYNNTFVDISSTSIYFAKSNYYPGGYNHDIFNNLFMGSTSHHIEFFTYYPDGRVWEMTCDHNGYSDSVSTVAEYSDTGEKTLSQWQSLGFGTGSLHSSFSIKSDYSLPSTSKAIKAGRNEVDMGAFPYVEDSWFVLAGYNKDRHESRPSTVRDFK